MKLGDGYSVAWRQLSLPVRGAWIEILLGGNGQRQAVSLPVRGAWIEMP